MFWSCLSSLTGATSIMHRLFPKKLVKLWPTSRPPLDFKAWSKYWSAEVCCSSGKSRSTQDSDGLLPSIPSPSIVLPKIRKVSDLVATGHKATRHEQLALGPKPKAEPISTIRGCTVPVPWRQLDRNVLEIGPGLILPSTCFSLVVSCHICLFDLVVLQL